MHFGEFNEIRAEICLTAIYFTRAMYLSELKIECNYILKQNYKDRNKNITVQKHRKNH